jgi:hypothetical protein
LKTQALSYDEPKDVGPLPKMSSDDFPWESPKSPEGRRQYDTGPGSFASTLIEGWPDFTALGITSHKSFGYNGLYRGNLTNPKVVILADQESNDDMFSTRALTGTGGQKLQSLLNAMGLNNDYVIIRTLPVDSSDLNIDKVKSIAMNNDVVKVRNNILEKILAQGKTKLFITVGPVAAALVPATFNPAGVTLVSLDSPTSDSHVQQWNSAIGKLSVAGIGMTGSYKGELSAIPRSDLPAHTRWWMGTSGSRSSRARGSGDYYQFNAPNWVNSRSYPANPAELGKRPNDPYKSAYATSINLFKSSDIAAEE